MWTHAAVLRESGSPLAIERIRLRALDAHEVLVRLHAAGVCHTDYEAATGSYPVAVPVVLGHEGAGVVVSLGSAVTGLAKGDHVVCSVAPGCAGCFYCDRSLSVLCEGPRIGPRRGRPTMSDANGDVQTFLNVSSFSEYCILPSRGAVRVPAELPFDLACLLGCAVATGVGAVSRIARVQAGESVAVVGCGAVGLNVIQGARMAGAALIIAIDTSPHKLVRARALGATHTFLAGDEGLLMTVRTLTEGRGVDHGFEAAAVVASLQLTLDLTRPGATVTILGKTARDREVALRFGSLMGERRILRSSLGGTRPQEDFVALAEAWQRGDLDLDSQIDLRLPLADVGRAMKEIEAGTVVRTILKIH